MEVVKSCSQYILTDKEVDENVCVCRPYNVWYCLCVELCNFEVSVKLYMSVALWQLLYEPLHHLFSLHLLLADEEVPEIY